MYNKPSQFDIGSTQQLVDMAIKYGGANANQWLAKVMQNPSSGIDPTLAVLAGMQLKQMQQPPAQAPNGTVKEDLINSGLQQASVPQEMFSSEVGEAPVQMAAGGLVAFSGGGQVPVSDPELKEAWKNAKSKVEKDAIEAEDRARIQKETPRGLPAPGRGGVGTYSKDLSGPTARGVGENLRIMDPLIPATQRGGFTPRPAQKQVAAGLGAIPPEEVAAPARPKTLPGEHFSKGPPPYTMTDEEQAKALPPIEAPGSGNGASASASYTPGGRPLGLNTDIDKEIDTLEATRERKYPKTAMEIESEKWLGEEAVEGRAKDQKRQDLWESLMYLGFNAAASDSPYWTKAWGQAGKELAPVVSGMMKARKEEKVAVQKGRQAMAQAKRAQNEETLQLANSNVSEARKLEAQARMEQERLKASWAETQARIASANRPGRDEKFVDYLAKKKMKDGMSEIEAYDQASREVMDSNTGLRKYNETQEKMTRKDAGKEFNSTMEYTRKYREMKKEEGEAAAEAYKERMIENLMNRREGATGTTASDDAYPDWGKDVNIR